MIINVDNHPTIMMLCIEGAGVMTTSRDMNSAQLVPEWDAFCAKQIGKQATQNGQP